MVRNASLVLVLFSVETFACSGGTATAGWFGPKNYQECVLERMVGKKQYMLETAEKACDLEFPCPDENHKAEYSEVLSACRRHAANSEAERRATCERRWPRNTTMDDLLFDVCMMDGCVDQARRQACPDR